MAAPEFTSFPKDTVEFLTALKKNNDRNWFSLNKNEYERAVKRPAERFCDEMTMRLQRLTGVEHGSKIFRIHRDVRFSKDKTPYNTHLHITLTPRTNEQFPSAWFFGLDTGSIAFGTGFMMFDKARLEAYRTVVDGDNGEDLVTLLDRLRKDSVRIGEPELKRVPAPFPRDHQHAELLRHKSLSAWVDIGDPLAASRPDFANFAEASFKRLTPLFSWFLSN